MKTATGILSIYVVMLSLSFSPGIQIFESQRDCCHAEQHDCCTDGHRDSCTPFRTCSVCSAHGFVVNEIVDLKVSLQENATELNGYTQSIYLPPYIKGILQPPKFA